jgi:hypothetical protein
MSRSSEGGSFIALILGVIFIWALAFGVNYHGVHYGISCNHKGVSISP